MMTDHSFVPMTPEEQVESLAALHARKDARRKRSKKGAQTARPTVGELNARAKSMPREERRGDLSGLADLIEDTAGLRRRANTTLLGEES
jgi:hypothetical protein